MTHFSWTAEKYKHGFGLQHGLDTELWMGNGNFDLITHNYSGQYGELPIERYGYNGGICAMDAKLVWVGPGSGYYRLHYAKETKTGKTTRSKLYGHRNTVSSQASSVWLNLCAKFAFLCTQTEDRSSDYYSHVHVTGCTVVTSC